MDGKVVAIVVDNASNITNGVELSDNKLIRCGAHTLQLCIKGSYSNLKCKSLEKKVYILTYLIYKDAFTDKSYDRLSNDKVVQVKKVFETIEKCRKIVSHFRRSNKAMCKLRAIQKDLKVKPLKLKAEV